MIAVTIHHVPHFVISNYGIVTGVAQTNLAISLPDICIARTLHNVHFIFLHTGTGTGGTMGAV
jgi:hypothetical protein